MKREPSCELLEADNDIPGTLLEVCDEATSMFKSTYQKIVT